MGFLSDLAMGLGLQKRDADYYERTAKTLGRTQGAEREAKYRQSKAFTEQPQRAGVLSMLGNDGQLNRQFSYTDASGNRVSALRDMFDGGGAGRSGQQFEGGLLASLANALGIRPLDYQQPTATATPQPAAANSSANPSAVERSIRPQKRSANIGVNNRLTQLPLPVTEQPMGPVRWAGDPLAMALTPATAQPSQGNMGSLPTRGGLLTTLPAAAATYQPSPLQPIGPSYDYIPSGAYYNPMTIPGTGMQDALNFALSRFGNR